LALVETLANCKSFHTSKLQELPPVWSPPAATRTVPIDRDAMKKFVHKHQKLLEKLAKEGKS